MGNSPSLQLETRFLFQVALPHGEEEPCPLQGPFGDEVFLVDGPEQQHAAGGFSGEVFRKDPVFLVTIQQFEGLPPDDLFLLVGGDEEPHIIPVALGEARMAGRL